MLKLLRSFFRCLKENWGKALIRNGFPFKSVEAVKEEYHTRTSYCLYTIFADTISQSPSMLLMDIYARMKKGKDA
ncbi:MAG: hypothetical protein ABFD18_15380, partial [Syntrophomonas sp.]